MFPEVLLALKCVVTAHLKLVLCSLLLHLESCQLFTFLYLTFATETIRKLILILNSCKFTIVIALIQTSVFLCGQGGEEK